MTATEFRSLGDGLARVLAGFSAVLSPAQAHLLTLTRMPSTTSITARLAADRARYARWEHQLAEIAADRVAARTGFLASLQGLQQRIAATEADLARAQERDRRQAARPGGCACLGLGGTGIPFKSPTGLIAWSEPCIVCPEGRLQLAAVAAAEAAWEAEREHEEQARARQARMARATIPAHYAACTLESFPVSAATAPIVAALRAFGAKALPLRGVYLAGPYGVGKTGLAIGALKAAIAAGHGGRFITTPELLDAIRTTYGARATEDEQTVLDRYRLTPLLVLDDLGAERVTDWTRGKLFELIDGRKNARKLTIITSNFTPGELVSRFASEDDPHMGRRLVDRLLEMCTLAVIHATAPNLRDHDPGTLTN